MMFTDQYHVDARARAKEWRAANPMRVQEDFRARYTADPESYRARACRWRTANPERKRANDKAYRAANPERHRAATIQRRARKRGAITALTAAEWEAILEAAGHACIYCGSQEQITQDHLTPLARAGEHTAENVAPACLPCNQRKGVKDTAEFLEEAV